MILYKNLADRWQREIFFMQKETPGLKQEIQMVSRGRGNEILFLFYFKNRNFFHFLSFFYNLFHF
jgi:hypothetical protein